MNFHVEPNGSGWRLRNAGASRGEPFRLRRDAIKAAKKRAVKGDVVYVHNASGMVVIRIPEIRVEKSAAVLTIKDAPDMTSRGKKEIAEWLRRQARMLMKDGDKYAVRFTARYLYV